MRILIDVQTLYTAEKSRGIGVYTYFWLKELISLNDNHRIYLMRRKEGKWQFSFISKYIELDQRLLNDFVWETYELEDFIKKNYINVINFTSPMMFDIEIPNVNHLSIKKTYIVYDIIPLIMREHYYDLWPSHVREIYNERLEIIKEADLILSISDCTKSDLISHLGIDSNKIQVIYGSTNEELYIHTPVSNEERQMLSELNISEPFLFTLTGYDFRKNNNGVISSFSKIALNYPKYKLVIGGVKGANEREEYYRYATEKGISSSQIHMLEYVSQECLVALYKCCNAFLFPSLYEGFGLPVLEAMRCGASVVTSNNSSLSEVAGDSCVLVNPTDEEELASAVTRLLDNPEFSNEMRKKGLNQAKKFSWNSTSKQSMDLFESLFEKTKNIISDSHKPLLAYFSPLNPQSSGISDYSEELLLYLKDFFEIKIFVNGFIPINSFVSSNFDIYEYEHNKGLIESISNRLYHIGNNELHDWIYSALKKFPGTVVLHDLNLFGFNIYTTYLRDKKIEFCNEMAYCHGAEGLEAANQLITKGTYPDSQQFPMFKKIVELSNAVITHSLWVKENIELYTEFKGNITVIPHGFVFENQETNQSKNILKLKLGMDNKKLALGVFGNVIPNKRLEVIIRCFAKLLKTNPDSQLYIIGFADDSIKKSLNQLIHELSIKKNIEFVSAPDIELFKEHIKATDICINLRWPTMGETSGTLMRALGYGIPCIVSNVGSYQEYPDDCVWKVDVDDSEEDLLLAYLIELCNNPKVREDMGYIAKAYIKRNNDFNVIASLYFNTINC